MDDHGNRIARNLGMAVALSALVAWMLSATSGLNVPASGAVLARLVTLVVVTGLCWMLGGASPLIGLRSLSPILYALLWWCWWPALDLWTSKELFVLFHYEDISVWRGAWYTKWGGFAFVYFAGVMLKK